MCGQTDRQTDRQRELEQSHGRRSPKRQCILIDAQDSAGATGATWDVVHASKRECIRALSLLRCTPENSLIIPLIFKVRRRGMVEIGPIWPKMQILPRLRCASSGKSLPIDDRSLLFVCVCAHTYTSPLSCKRHPPSCTHKQIQQHGCTLAWPQKCIGTQCIPLADLPIEPLDLEVRDETCAICLPPPPYGHSDHIARQRYTSMKYAHIGACKLVCPYTHGYTVCARKLTRNLP